MTFKSVVTTIHRDIKYFGVGYAFYDFVLRFLNQFLFLKILKVVALSELPPGPELPPQYRFRNIPGSELPPISQQREYSMNPLLLQDMQRGPNACFGIYDGNTLANYLFIFVTPVLMTEELEVSFDPRFAYLCAAFTHPQYRGLHMNSLASCLAAKEYLEKGFHGLLAYIESNNFSSLRSFRRMGWKTVGTIRIVRLFGRYFIYRDPKCCSYSFKISTLSQPADVANEHASLWTRHRDSRKSKAS